MDEFITGFLALGKQIENPSIQVKRYDIIYGNYNLPSLDTTLPKVVAEFYTRMKYFKCSWRLNNFSGKFDLINESDLTLIRGDVNFIDYEEQKKIISTKSQVSFLDPYDVYNKKDRAQLKHMIPLDYVRGKYALCFDTNSKNDGKIDLYFVDFGLTNRIRPIQKNLHEYFEIGLNEKFFLGWQEAYIFNDKASKDRINWYSNKLWKK